MKRIAMLALVCAMLLMSIGASLISVFAAPVTTSSEEENLALGAPVIDYSSSFDAPQYGCHHTYISDGDPAAGWASGLSLHTSSDAEEWIAIDLERLCRINKIVLTPQQLINGTNLFPEDYCIEVSTDNVAYTKVAEVIGDKGQQDSSERVLSFDSVEARYVRFHATKLALSGVDGQGYYVELREMAVYGEATEAKPEKEPNIALGAPVIDYSSSFDEPIYGCHHMYITDGTITGGWASGLSINMTPDAEEWITVDLQKVYLIDKVVLTPQQLINGTNLFPEDYCIEVSIDNVTYTKVAEVIGDKGQQDSSERVLSFDSVEARYVRFHATKLALSGVDGQGYYVELREMAVYGEPTDTDSETDTPTDFETDAPTDPETDAPTGPETDATTDPEPDAPTDLETDVPTDPVTDAPTDAPATGEATNSPTTGAPSDDEGCASVIGLSAVAVLATVAAGVVLRKKD